MTVTLDLQIFFYRGISRDNKLSAITIYVINNCALNFITITQAVLDRASNQYKINYYQSRRGKHRVFDSTIKLFAYRNILDRRINYWVFHIYITEWLSDITAKTMRPCMQHLQQTLCHGNLNKKHLKRRRSSASAGQSTIIPNYADVVTPQEGVLILWPLPIITCSTIFLSILIIGPGYFVEMFGTIIDWRQQTYYCLRSCFPCKCQTFNKYLIVKSNGLTHNK